MSERDLEQDSSYYTDIISPPTTVQQSFDMAQNDSYKVSKPAALDEAPYSNYEVVDGRDSAQDSAYYTDIINPPTTQERFTMPQNDSYRVSKPVTSEEAPVRNYKKVINGRDLAQDSAYYTVSPPTTQEQFTMAQNDSCRVSNPAALEEAPVSNYKIVVIVFIVVLVALIVLTLGLAACCIAFAFEIAELKAGTVFPGQATSLQQSYNTLEGRLQDLNASFAFEIARLKAGTFPLDQAILLQHNINTIEDDLRNLSEIGFQLFNERFKNLTSGLESLGELVTFPASSCADLFPSSPSGYYWVRASNGSAVRVYCNMTLTCGGVTGGWMRVAELDMTNSSHQCPSGLRQRNDSNIRTCVRNTDQPGCSAVQYPTANVQYSRVCGKVIGYQFGLTNAFADSSNDISLGTYADGVSLTHGSPREHIWTFVAAFNEADDLLATCRCMNSEALLPPSFVGTDYFCDTANEQFPFPDPFIFFPNNPLWDGAGCGSTSTCCEFNTPPWFHKKLPESTSDDIEMRLCRNENANDEDVAIEMVEIYVQ